MKLKLCALTIAELLGPAAQAFARSDLNTLWWDITIIDPGAYQKPFTVQTRARY